jgi:predicted CXXCH cytochrome family protein
VALLVALGAASPVLAQNPFKLKPGARGALCLDCHVAFEETLALPHVHTPVKAGDCADCHDPHASSHGMMLDEGPEGVCLSCHEDLRAESPVSAHSAVLEGRCNLCHDPHASEHAQGLLRPGNQLCTGCHEGVAATVARASFGHAPVQDDCLACHDPHSSSSAASLLSRDEPGLCLDCHDASGTAFRDRHVGYPVEEGRCSSCHAPHGSNEGGILLAQVHRPVVNRMCSQCHEAASAPNALEVKSSGIDLCRRCHSDTVNEAFAARRLHWPVADREACLSCHSPHASSVSGLLSEPMGPLCGSCHADVIARGERSVTEHPPVAEGDCTACHQPHASDELFLFESASSEELCGSCHDWKQHSAHPLGEGVTDLRNPNLEVDCSSCHRTHGSPHKHLANFDVRAELCTDCHESLRR